MKKSLLILVAALLVFQSCGVSSMYYWGGNEGRATRYEKCTYDYYKSQTPESVCRLLCAYENIIMNPSGTRQVPPPGICAEYGYLLLQENSADFFIKYATDEQKKLFGSDIDYVSAFNDRGRQMLEKEIELYPESVVFIKPLIKKLAK